MSRLVKLPVSEHRPTPVTHPAELIEWPLAWFWLRPANSLPALCGHSSSLDIKMGYGPFPIGSWVPSCLGERSVSLCGHELCHAIMEQADILSDCNSQLLQQGLLGMCAVPIPGGSQPSLRSQLAAWTSVTKQWLYFSISKILWVHKKIFAFFFTHITWVSLKAQRHFTLHFKEKTQFQSPFHLREAKKKEQKSLHSHSLPWAICITCADSRVNRGWPSLPGTFCPNPACETSGFLLRDYAGALGPGESLIPEKPCYGRKEGSAEVHRLSKSILKTRQLLMSCSREG